MTASETSRMKASSGQSLIETALVVPLLLLVILNAINLGYIGLVTLNLSAATRSGIEYAIQGSATPGGPALPTATGTSTNTVAYLIYQDMTGALYSPTTVQVQVCSGNLGVAGSGASQTAKCQTCTNSGCTGVSTTTGSPTPHSDPEAVTGFVLNRVDVTYTFNTIVPATPFNLVIASFPTCSSSNGTVTCTFRRHAEMRAMGS